MSGEESSTSRADPEELFELDTVIGHGAAGRVYKAIEKQTKKTVAIKILPVVEDDEQAYNKLMLEITMMEQCASPNIVSFQGSYMKDNDLWIVMEFCDGGSLFGMMSKMGEGLNEKQISVVMYDMLQGLQYLHSRRMIHRDIKADNVLLTLDGVAKLADLGVAASLSNTMESRNTATGTPYWMAPELIQERPYNFGVDIWSLGITAIECADKKPPFFDMPPMRALFVIAKFGDPNDLTPSPSVSQGDKWSDTFKDFISLCLTKDVQLRPTAEQLLQHPFVKNGDKDRAELKAHVERFLVVQAEKRAEKEQRKELYRKKNPRSARDMMQKLADLDASKSVTKVNIVKLYPMGYDCFLEKERTPWSSTPIGGLQFETHILANFANEERVTLVQTEKLLRLMKDPKRGLDIKTRTYRMRKHKECFVAAEAIIWFTQKLGLSSVEEALAIGECLVHRGLIYHVLRNEPFSDSKTSFFKFAEESEIDDQEQLYAGKITIMVEMMRWGLEIKDRKWRHKTYLLCFLGCDAVDWVIKTLGMESREEAQELCQTLMDRSVFHHVSFDETFIDKPVPYRFTQDDKKYAPVSSFSRTQAFSKANSILEKMELRDEQPSSSSSATPSNSKSSKR